MKYIGRILLGLILLICGVSTITSAQIALINAWDSGNQLLTAHYACNNSRLFISTSTAFSIVDVSNPLAPFYISTVTDGGLSGGGVIVEGNYAYVPSNYFQGDSISIDVIDIHNIQFPYLVGRSPRFPQSSYWPYRCAKDGNLIYVSNSHQFIVVDVTNPHAPNVIRTFLQDGSDPIVDFEFHQHQLYFTRNNHGDGTPLYVCDNNNAPFWTVVDSFGSGYSSLFKDPIRNRIYALQSHPSKRYDAFEIGSQGNLIPLYQTVLPNVTAMAMDGNLMFGTSGTQGSVTLEVYTVNSSNWNFWANHPSSLLPYGRIVACPPFVYKIGGSGSPGTQVIEIYELSNVPVSNLGETSSNEAINLFPNPVSDLLEIHFEVLGKHRISLVDIQGRQIGQYQNSKELFLLNIDNLEAGSYFIVIESNSGKVVKKITKL